MRGQKNREAPPAAPQSRSHSRKPSAIGNVNSRRRPDDFFARAFLQPYAAGIRSRSNMRWSGPTPYQCPFCKRKPGLGVLRPLGDGGQRSLVCSFCLAEWEFRRIVCPGCGEENHAKLPVYTAEELKHVRVKLVIVARATSRRWTLRKADSPNLSWMKWLRSRSICGRRTRDTRSCNPIFYSFDQKKRTII